MRVLSIPTLCSLLLVTGCGSGQTESVQESGSVAEPVETEYTAPTAPTAPAAPAAPAVLVALESQSVEVGCGMCIYHLPGVDRCEPAALVDGVPVLLLGVPEAVGHSVCSETKMAVVSAEVEGDRLRVTSLDIEQ